MIRYKMYERELTQGGSYQYHTCVDKFDEYDIDLYDYECNITPKNETSPHDYIHVSCLKKGVDKFIRKSVLDYFNIPVDFPVVYFTRKVPFTSEFKCGFYINTYKKFNSLYFNQTIQTIKLFKGLYNDVFLAGDFDGDGLHEVCVNSWDIFSMGFYVATGADAYRLANDLNEMFIDNDPGSFNRVGFAFHDIDNDGSMEAWFPMTNGVLYYLDPRPLLK